MQILPKSGNISWNTTTNSLQKTLILYMIVSRKWVVCLPRPDFDTQFIKIVEAVFFKALKTYLGFFQKRIDLKQILKEILVSIFKNPKYMIGVDSVNIRFSDVDVDARATDIMAFSNINFLDLGTPNGYIQRKLNIDEGKVTKC